MSNVYIPKSNPLCTMDLNKYIDKPFKSIKKLYYKIDYTLAMQVIDKQHIFYDINNVNNGICIINTELKKNGQILYAIIIKNKKYKSKQRWKIINYKHISQAFMTSKQIYNIYGINKKDLPIGSKIKHNKL